MCLINSCKRRKKKEEEKILEKSLPYLPIWSNYIIIKHHGLSEHTIWCTAAQVIIEKFSFSMNKLHHMFFIQLFSIKKQKLIWNQRSSCIRYRLLLNSYSLAGNEIDLQRCQRCRFLIGQFRLANSEKAVWKPCSFELF